MSQTPDDPPPKPQVVPYRSPPRPEPPVSGVDALAGIVISSVALLVITVVSVSIAGGLGVLTQNTGVALIALFLGMGGGIWFLHRLAQGEKDINRGLMIGIYIGIGMYLLGIGACAMGALGVRF